MSKTYDINSRFMIAVNEIRDNGTMNVYVDAAITNQVDTKSLTKEIKQAIRMHRKWDAQAGSSHLHCAVVLAMGRLLTLIEEG